MLGLNNFLFSICFYMNKRGYVKHKISKGQAIMMEKVKQLRNTMRLMFIGMKSAKHLKREQINE
jgi:hypothetical protein